MSKQEVTSGENDPVVMMEQKGSSRHKPYRPTDLQDEASLELHKRSRAPAVPSVDYAEELKDTTMAKEITSDTKEHIEAERAISSEKQSHHAKKVPSKRRSSPENIAMALKDVQKDGVPTIPQPIPDQDALVLEKPRATIEEKGKEKAPDEKAAKEKAADEDSITEEIAELRTEDPAKAHSGWIEQPTNSNAIKKKEITWEDNEYLDKVNLQNEITKSQATLLERTASVGPCFKPKMLYGGPSGIFVSVPKKSIRNMKEDFNPLQSVINFNVPKKMESKSAPHLEAQYQKRVYKKTDGQKQKPAPKILEKELKIEPTAHTKFFEVLRGKLDNLTSKIKNLLNI